jgi:hypothetical protein
MASTLEHLEIDDYDTWKREIFDKDPARRSEIVSDTRSFAGWRTRARCSSGWSSRPWATRPPFGSGLLASGALEGIKVKPQATVVDVADTAEY